jgi:NTE family protein
LQGEEGTLGVKTIGLALGGGGARGLCHVAFIRALEDLGLKASVVSGTSIGAIAGGFYAAGKTSRDMMEIIDRINFKTLSKMADFSLFRSPAFIKGKRIQQFLDENIPKNRFEDLAIPLKVVATDFWRRQEIVFDSGPLIPAIRASMSIPALFEPVQLDGRVLVDGGVTNPVPYDVIREDCELLIAVDVSGTRIPLSRDRLFGARGPVPTLFESVVSTFDIMQESIIESRMRTARPDILVKPELRDVHLLDFHRADEILAGVEQDVEQFKRDVDARMRKKKRFVWF